MMNNEKFDIAFLYLSHVKTKLETVQVLLSRDGYDALIIGSGDVRVQFMDDLPYPTKSNPYIREWLPISQEPMPMY